MFRLILRVRLLRVPPLFFLKKKTACVDAPTRSCMHMYAHAAYVHMHPPPVNFNHQNCAGCPIIGQLEVVGHHTSVSGVTMPADMNFQWIADDGIFFPTLKDH